MVTQGGRIGAERDGTERNGTGRDRHALCFALPPSLSLLYGYTGWPGRDKTEQEGTGTTQAAVATILTRAATATQEATGSTHAIIFLSLFLYFHLFFVSLFFFSCYLFSGKYNNRRGTKGKRRTDGTGCTRVAIAM